MDMTEIQFNLNKMEVKYSPYEWEEDYTEEYISLSYHRTLKDKVSNLSFKDNNPRRVLKMYVLALNADGRQAEKKMRSLTSTLSEVGGLYKIVVLFCLVLSWFFAQPLREIQLAEAYENMD